MKLIRGFDNIDLAKVKKLYADSFQDANAFTDLYFTDYKKMYDLWTLWENEQLVLMTCLNKKRVVINNIAEKTGIIVAVAVDKQYQGKGIMKNFMNSFLDEAKLLYSHIFIQAYNWNVYKSWNFHVCTKKYKSRLKKDQFLKPVEISQKINFDKCNEIYNQYVKLNEFNNFTYRTNKENKLIMKMLLAAGDQIIHSQNSYLIFSKENGVIDYAYNDEKDFIRLLSSLPYDTPIWAHKILDKRFFNYLDEEKIETKILDEENLEVLFSEFF
ncbi:MAG: GNAT family N-acetyltransferase [Mycoplasmoidaceae bacterium]